VRKLSNEELQAALIAGDFNLLWEAAAAPAKAAVTGMLMRGEVEGEKDELVGEAYLAAGKAVRKWEPAKGSFATWIGAYVKTVVKFHWLKQYKHAAQLDRDANPEELADPNVVLSVDTVDAERVRGLLTELSPLERKLICRHFGIGQDEETTIRTLAAAYGMPSSTLHDKMREILNKLAAA
jgi:DNA-directed RNA polymerase specialized sigma24 family protein